MNTRMATSKHINRHPNVKFMPSSIESAIVLPPLKEARWPGLSGRPVGPWLANQLQRASASPRHFFFFGQGLPPSWRLPLAPCFLCQLPL